MAFSSPCPHDCFEPIRDILPNNTVPQPSPAQRKTRPIADLQAKQNKRPLPASGDVPLTKLNWQATFPAKRQAAAARKHRSGRARRSWAAGQRTAWRPRKGALLCAAGWVGHCVAVYRKPKPCNGAASCSRSMRAAGFKCIRSPVLRRSCREHPEESPSWTRIASKVQSSRSKVRSR